MRDDLVRISKFLSYVLRHRPQAVGLVLDAQGWAEVEALRAARRQGINLNRERLAQVVCTNDKRRFALSQDGLKIRASHGHSVEVGLGYPASRPPRRLFHGTATRFLDSIRKRGLARGRRRHVHLSADALTALAVGRRHGEPIVLIVKAGEMHAAGHRFYLSANGIWLTEHVPPEHLLVPAQPAHLSR